MQPHFVFYIKTGGHILTLWALREVVFTLPPQRNFVMDPDPLEVLGWNFVPGNKSSSGTFSGPNHTSL